MMSDHYDRAWDEGYARALADMLVMVAQVDDRHKNCEHVRKIQKNIVTKLDKLHQETMFPAT